MKKALLFFCGILVYTFHTDLRAQSGQSPVSYSSLALQFAGSDANGDPQSAVLPSVALSNGFGGYLDNPASIALLEGNYLTTSLLGSTTEQKNSYLNSTFESENSRGRFSNVGAVFQVPTEQGKMVIGAGYNLFHDTNRYDVFGGRNNESTITDQFKDPSSDYHDIAFETYAIDYADTASSYLESIFRIGFGPGGYPGITQQAVVEYRSHLGEYSAFFGTEFRKNLFLGVSAGLISGEYSYERNFIEFDEFDDYDGNFIPSDREGEGTDILEIETFDEVSAGIKGFTGSIGVIYRVTDFVNAGFSFTLPTVLEVEEYYYSSIETRLDDGSTPFYDETPEGYFVYKVTRPARYSGGLAIEKFRGLSISVAGEYIDYSKTDIDFTESPDLNIINALREEQLVDSVMASDYKKVFNLKAGAKYLVNDKTEVRAGIAFFPSRSKKANTDMSRFSAGLGYRINSGMVLDLSTQYSTYKDRSVAYSYYDDSTGHLKQPQVNHDISNFRIQAGIKFLF